MRRRAFIEGIAASAAAWPPAARAQQSGKKCVVGRFGAGSATAPLNEVTTEALRELGWVEGENVVYERRFAENRVERLPELAADLVGLKVDVIVAGGTLAPLAAKRATSTIPIVMNSCGDPLGTGLVASLARPGGNVTGMSLMVPELAGKRLELLRDILPKLARVAVLCTFVLLSGKLTEYRKTADSGNVRVQAFCPHCGTAIYATSTGDEPKAYNVRVGALRQRNELVPRRQIFVRSQQPWANDLNSIPKFEGMPH